MFAIFLSSAMDPFYQNIASFPTAIYTFLLALCLLYWLLAVLGLVDLDFLDFGMDGANMDVANAETSHSVPDVLAGLMLRLGLYGVPVTLIVSLIALFGWMICYYSVYLLTVMLPEVVMSGWVRYLLGLPVLAVTFFVSVLLTGQVIKPLRKFFQSATQHTEKHILGQSAIVRSQTLTETKGEVFFNDGGAGLILKARAGPGVTFQKGESVVLLEYLPDQYVYRVISEQEFSGIQSTRHTQ
jgi:hypothetical protein